MTTREIEMALTQDRYSRGLLCPHYTPRGWFECDVFEVTAAGYFREYEVKVSVSDFFADAGKRGRWQELTKHQRLAKGDATGPSRFWFVAPAGLIPLNNVPPWAGLMECHPRSMRQPWSVGFHPAKPAPQLHRNKCPEHVLAHCRGIFYYRFLSVFLHADPTGRAVA